MGVAKLKRIVRTGPTLGRFKKHAIGTTVTDENKYEAIEMIIRKRDDGKSWFDVLFDFITEDCEEVDDTSCTCGMESMGGTSGTIEQCWDWTTTVGDKLQPIDLATAIVGLHAGLRDDHIRRVLNWAEKQIESEKIFEQWVSEEEEE